MVRSFLTRAAVGLLSLAALSCASGSVFQLSLEEQAALREALDTPLTFIVPREESIESWDRAREFLDRYSSMKLRSTTDSMLVSYDTPTYSSDPSSVDPGGIQVVVQCTASTKRGDEFAKQNAHLAASYILTGYLGCTRCIVR